MISARALFVKWDISFYPTTLLPKKKKNKKFLHINIVALCSKVIFFTDLFRVWMIFSLFLLQCPSVLCYYCWYGRPTVVIYSCWSQWDSGLTSFSYTTWFELSSERMESSSALMEKRNNCPKCCQLRGVFVGFFFGSHSKYFICIFAPSKIKSVSQSMYMFIPVFICVLL